MNKKSFYIFFLINRTFGPSLLSCKTRNMEEVLDNLATRSGYLGEQHYALVMQVKLLL